MNLVDKITQKQMRPDVPEFRVGDTVRVDYKIIEGKRERIQAYEGIVVARHVVEFLKLLQYVKYQVV